MIHSVVIGQGFFKLAETESLTGCVFLCLIFIFAIVDWHLFYKLYDRLTPYPLYFWVWDYLLLALLAVSVSKAIRSDMGFFVVSCLWFFGTLAWWFFVPPGYGVSHKLLWCYIRRVVKGHFRFRRYRLSRRN